MYQNCSIQETMGTYDDPLKMLNKTKAKQTPTPNT